MPSMDTSDTPGSAPILNMVGERVAFGPYDRDLLPLYLKWVNDFEVTRHFHDRLAPWTKERRLANYERYSQGGSDFADFTIYERESLRPIGFTSLEAIDHMHRTATFGILVGEKDCWGKGYGTEVTHLMLDYAFTLLRLHNVLLQVDKDNVRAVRAYTRAGFRVIGERREAHFLAGKVGGVLYMDCLSSEFTSPLLHRLADHPQGETQGETRDAGRDRCRPYRNISDTQGDESAS